MKRRALFLFDPVDPAVIVDDPDGDGTGDLFLMERSCHFLFFGGVGKESHFQQNTRHIQRAQNGKSSPADAPVFALCTDQHGFLKFKRQKKVIGIKAVAGIREIDDLFLIGG